jgi:hypothetical protein
MDLKRIALTTAIGFISANYIAEREVISSSHAQQRLSCNTPIVFEMLKTSSCASTLSSGTGGSGFLARINRAVTGRTGGGGNGGTPGGHTGGGGDGGNTGGGGDGGNTGGGRRGG